jgi:hypothetical protein
MFKRKSKRDAAHAEFLMETDEELPSEVYEGMTKEPEFPEMLGDWVSRFEPSVRDLYARGGSDEQITVALIETMREFIPEMDPRVVPYFAARVQAEIKFADPEHPLGSKGSGE